MERSRGETASSRVTNKNAPRLTLVRPASEAVFFLASFSGQLLPVCVSCGREGVPKLCDPTL